MDKTEELRLRDENRRLREALVPFAGFANWVDAGEYMGADDDSPLWAVLMTERPTVGDCRRALSLLEEISGQYTFGCY